jgi:hypothetical protein
MLNARAIISGATCATALCLGGLLGPPGSGLALLAAPLPGLAVGGAAGALQATLSSVAAGGIMSGVLGWPVGIGFLVLAGVPAALTVVVLRRAGRLEAALATAVAATLLGGAGLLLAVVPDVSSWQAMFAQAWTASFDGALAIYRDLGMPADQIGELEAGRADLGATLLRFLPAIVIVISAALWLANLRVSSRWVGWPQLAALSRWRLPDACIWVLIGAGFAMFVPVRPIAVVAVNVFAVALACYFFQGLAIVSFFLQRFGLPRGLRIATYVVIALQYIAAGLVLALGVFDLWGDFRHLAARPADAAVGSDSD